MARRDRDNIRSLYEQLINENITPLAVKKSANGEGETGGLTPDELPSDAASTTEMQKGTGAENAKDVPAREEAGEDLSPVKKDKGTMKTAKQKKVTSIKDSVEPRKSFMDLFDQVMVKEEEGDIESPAYNDEEGDFPETEEEIPAEEEGMDDEGEIYSQLSDLFGRLAEIKGAGMAGEGDMEGLEDEMGGMEDEMGNMPPTARQESVRARGKAISEMRSEPEPRELSANSSERQLPTKLAGKGVTKGSSKKAAMKGNDKKRTGELEDAPEGFKHDKSKYAVKGEGPIHKAKNASFTEG